MKKLVVLGSTGSIGLSTLDILRRRPGEFTVVGLSAGSNVRLLEEQAREFRVELVSTVSDPGRGLGKRQVIRGANAAAELVALAKPDIVVNGISGAAGFLP